MRISLLVFLTITVFSAASQDLLIYRNGDTIKAVVMVVHQDHIVYKKFGDTTGTTAEIPKYELSKIKYAQGGIDDFSKWLKPKYDTLMAVVPDSTKVLYDLGMKDADLYYRGYRTAGTTTYILSAVCSPAIGAVSVGFCNTEGPTENLGFPDTTLRTNSFYSDGYMTAAKRKKSKKVWTNFYFGSLTWIVLAAFLTSTHYR